MNIVLCGFMGSGKTTVGRLLSSRTGRVFIDTDSLIEKNAGMSISEIFDKYGEQEFRKMEQAAVEQAADEINAVIATGGGVVLNKENICALKKTGKIFFLDITPETVLSRLKNNTTRPLLQRPDKENAVRTLMNERRGKYLSSADYVVNSANSSPSQVVKEIIGEIKK